MGFSVVLPKELGNPFLSVGLFGLWQILEKKKTWLILFFSVAWSLWLLHNDVIFKQKISDYDTLFFFIITRLCFWIKALNADFPYSTSDLIRSVKGLIHWTNTKKPRVVVMWSPSMANNFKWNVDGSSLGKPGPQI